MDRDFLFGVLAVQLGQATPAQVMAAASAHVADRSRSIAERLRGDGQLDEERWRMLDAMVDQAVRSHGGDVARTMQSLGGERVLLHSFGGSLVVDEAGHPSVSASVPAASDSIEDTVAVTPEAEGRYRLTGDEVGRGGIGRVLVAFDEHLGREIAVKELLADTTATPPSVVSDGLTKTAALVARFLREARVTGQLEHPNIMPVYELGQRADDAFYYTMKLVRGRTLADALSACKGLRARLELLHHYVDLCNAIAYAHSRGVIHRDIKTDNVMLGEFGETVVIDWGLAKVRGKKDIRGGDLQRELELLHDDAAGKTVVGSAIGTPSYMSPEQADGAVDEIDERSDIWSLGAVLYELLAGRPPFQGVTPFEVIGKVLKDPVVPARQIDEAVPAELSAVAEKALQRSKSERYPSAAELARDVEAYMSGGRIGAYRYSTWELVKLFVLRHKAVSALALVVVVVIVGSSVFLYRAYKHAERARAAAEQSERQATDSELQAQLNLARALQEKADRLAGEHRVLASRIYAAAALVHHPCNRLGLTSASACDQRFPGGSKLRLEAVSTVYQQGFHVLARPEWVHRTESTLEGLQVSRDGSRMIIWGQDAQIQLWDVKARRLLSSLVASPRMRQYRIGRSLAALSPSGKLIAISQPEDSIAIWDDAGRKVVALEQVGPDHYLSFSQDGSLLAASGRDGRVVLWDTKTWAVRRAIEMTYRNVLRYSLSPDATLVATATAGQVSLWSVTTGELLHTFEIEGVIRLTFSPDGRRLAGATVRRTVELFGVPERKHLGTLRGHAEAVAATDFVDGLLVSASSDKTLRFCYPATQRTTYVLEGHEAPIHAVRFLPAARMIASVGQDKTLRLWRLDREGMVPTLAGHTGPIWGIDLTADGRLVSGAEDPAMRLWDTRSHEQIGAFTGDEKGYTTVGFSGDATKLVAAGTLPDGSKRVTIRDMATGEVARTIATEAFSASVSPDGRLVATTSMSGMTELWDAVSGARVRELETDGGGQSYAVFSPDGRELATSGVDNSVRIWDVASGKRRLTLKGHPDGPYNFDFSADGKQLLSGGKDGHLFLWDLTDGKQIREYVGHQRWVNDNVFVPGKPLFISSSDEGTVRLWSLETGENLLVLRTVREAYRGNVTHDGKTLILTDGEGLNVIKLYPIDLSVRDADPQKLLEQAEAEAHLKLEGFSLVPRP